MNENSQLQKVLNLVSDLHHIQDLDILLDRMLTTARQSVGADAGSIYIVEGNDLSIKYSQNDTLTKGFKPGQKLIYSLFKIPINEKSIAGFVAHRGVSLNIPSMYAIPKEKPYCFDEKFDKASGYKTSSSLTFPLVTNGKKILGVLQLINAITTGGQIIPFSKADQIFLSNFASIATLAIQRAQMTRDILMRMIKMAEMRDPKETGNHVNRVGAYAAELYENWAYKHRVPKATIQKKKDILRVTAMLHDVGKVGISDIILKKPGRLDERERKVIQAHTHIGARLFPNDSSDIDAMAQAIALRHHENWNGTGYPGFITVETGEPLKGNRKTRGLRGREIPLFARIVSLVDVYDALSCHRTYKKAWDSERVLTTIQAERGIKFDPELLDIFMECLPVIRQIQSRYSDE